MKTFFTTVRSYFTPASLPHALGETFGLGLILMGLLQRTYLSIPSFRLSNGLLFLSGFLAFWLMLRLRQPAGNWARKSFLEFAHALLLTLTVSLIIPLLLDWIRISPKSPPSPTGLFTLWRLASGPLYLLFRTGQYAWCWWQRKRRKRLLWDLMHIQLSLAALVALVLILAGGVYIIAYSETYYPYESQAFFANLVLRLVQTVLPYLGITLVMALGALAVLLPPAALISYASVRRFTQRLEDLSRAARQLRGGDAAARTPVRGEDEIAQLQQDFNAMAADLAQALEALRVERDKVASLLEDRRQLLANVSHELRTPVATARSYLAPMIADDSQENPQAQELKTIQKELTRLSRLIDDLFALSRAEVGGLDLKIQPVNVNAVIQHMAATFQPLAWRGGRVEIVAETVPGDPHVPADPDRLEQALANLIRNAIRHTPPGGIIALQVEADAQWACLHVRDTGEGIPPEDLPRIWERFFRGEETHRNADRGAGLGLALVKELIEAMGGQVSVQSQPGQGSDFVIHLKTRQGEPIEKTTR